MPTEEMFTFSGMTETGQKLAREFWQQTYTACVNSPLAPDPVRSADTAFAVWVRTFGGGYAKGDAEPPPPQPKGKPGTWQREIHKFFQKTVGVSYIVGDEKHSVWGRLVAYHPDGNHVIIAGEKESTFVRLPLEIVLYVNSGEKECANA